MGESAIKWGMPNQNVAMHQAHGSYAKLNAIKCCESSWNIGQRSQKQKQGTDKMTFSDLDTITTAINAIETWASAVARESEKDEPNYERIERINKYLKEAKQEVFELCTK